MYHEVNSIHEKDAFEMRLTSDIMEPGFTTDSISCMQRFVKNLVGFYVIMEGIFFYSGFVMMLSFHRQNRMTGVGEQFQYILRDETIHLNFGIDLINGIKAENSELWTPDFQAELQALISEAVSLEVSYAEDCLPRGILGLNSGLFANTSSTLPIAAWSGSAWQPNSIRNPFPWMSETIDLRKPGCRAGALGLAEDARVLLLTRSIGSRSPPS